MLLLKMYFLSCWKKLELGFVNVDHLLNQIHMLCDEENGTSIIELVLIKIGNMKQDPEAMFIEDKLIEIRFREHIESFIADVQGLYPIQNKKRPFGMDLGPDSEEEEVVKKKIKNTEELAESVSDLIKLTLKTRKKKKKRNKIKLKKQLLYIFKYAELYKNKESSWFFFSLLQLNIQE